MELSPLFHKKFKSGVQIFHYEDMLSFISWFVLIFRFFNSSKTKQLWARICQNVPYGYINKNQTNDVSAKYYHLKRLTLQL